MGFVKKLGSLAKTFSKPVIDTTTVRNRSKNIIGFYGTEENSGTTSLLMNVAKCLEGTNAPTVVVDLTMESPSAFKYIVAEIPDHQSLVNKLKNPALSPHELVAGDTNRLGIISMSGFEHPSDYCDIELTTIESMLNTLSVHYKYVLVDLGTSLNADATIMGILTCNKVYSTVRPVATQISKLITVKEHIENIGHINKIKDVIQTMILNNPYDSKDYDEIGLNLVGNVPLDIDLMIAADNCKAVTQVGKSKAVAGYLKLVQSLSDDIRDMVEASAAPTQRDIIVGADNVENPVTKEEELDE